MPHGRHPHPKLLTATDACGRLTKNAEMNEEIKLEFIKEIGFCHMRVLDGLDTLLQLNGLCGKLCCCAASKGAKPPKK